MCPAIACKSSVTAGPSGVEHGFHRWSVGHAVADTVAHHLAKMAGDFCDLQMISLLFR